MKKNTKKKILILALVICLLALVSYSTLAYRTAYGRATNVVTTGGIRLELLETFPEGGYKVIPGASYEKVVTVKNTGGHDAWVRLKLVKQVDAPAGTPAPNPEKALSYTLLPGWTAAADGYVYYNKVLKPGETTTAAIDSVQIVGREVLTEHSGATLVLTVSAQGVQYEHNETANAWEASGWPVD